MNGSHVPVLRSEVLELLGARPADICVDATVGAGGHASALLEELGPAGRLIGIDRDESMLQKARALFAEDPRVGLYWTTFDNLREVLRESEVSQADVILCDLGVASPQLDDSERGFSFKKDGPLDMRMDRSTEMTAATVLERSSVEELAAIFRDFGEERHARRIARAIARRRREAPIRTTRQFADIVAGAVPGRGRIHPATRVFQALRIAVNRELELLEAFLACAPDCLSVGGRLSVISFHSLEDRLVKHAFRARDATENYQVMTRKPVRAERRETLENRRSRSAKLRVLRRVA